MESIWTTTTAPVAPGYTLWQMVRYMLRLGTLGFGGPVALAGYMHRDLVEARGWIPEDDYSEGIALAQLAPKPIAAQLAIYLGTSTTASLAPVSTIKRTAKLSD